MLPNNLRVSFFWRNLEGDVLSSMATATNWRDLNLLIGEQAKCFKENLVGLTLLNSDQETALDESAIGPCSKLLWQSYLTPEEHLLDVFITTKGGCNTLFDNPDYQRWRRVVQRQMQKNGLG